MNLHEIKQAIEVAKNEQMALSNPNLAAIEGQIQFHAARTIVGSGEDIAEHKTKLQAAIYAKSQAERILARHVEIKNKLARLNQDLQLAEEIERTARAESASRRCREAYAEYVAASKACARAFRRVMKANQQAWNIPGAVRANEDYRLHLPAIYSDYWIGTLGEFMRDGLLPFEQAEKEQQNA